MKSLEGFYAQSPTFIQELMETKEKIKKIADPFTEVSAGSPLVIKDDIALRLFEYMTLLNGHYVPGRLPASGMAIGDFIIHEEVSYITVNLSVIFLNNAYLHITRDYENTLVSWEEVRQQVYDDLTTLAKLVEKEYPEYMDQVELKNFHAACGLQYSSLPAKDFIDGLELLVKKMRFKRRESSKQITTLANAIIKACMPFVTVAPALYKLRGVFGNKGHLTYRGNRLGMSSPSFSGGSSWVHRVADNIGAIIPGQNNLFMQAAHSGKANTGAIGSGSDVARSISFLVTPDTITKIQMLVNARPELAKKWEEFAYIAGEDEKTITKKVDDWIKLIYSTIGADAKSIISEAVHGAVLGIQLDMSDINGKAILRPVISQTYLELSKNVLAERMIAAPVDAGFNDLLLELPDGYGKGESIFDVKEESVPA
jgi:hypothetical protein